MRHRIEYAILRGVAAIAARMSRSTAWIVAGWLARVFAIVGSHRVTVAGDNLRAAFPEASNEEIERLALASVRHLLQTFLEIPSLARAARPDIERAVTLANTDMVMDLLHRHGRVIFLSAHYGNWELGALCCALQLHSPFTIVGKPQHNPHIDRYLNRMRERFGNRIIPMDGALRSLLRTLDAGGSVALLADQSGEANDIFVPFFNRPAATTKAVAALSLKRDVPIVIGLVHRREDLTYELEFVEVPRDDLHGLTEPNVAALTARHVQTLETLIRRAPEQWLWMHRRWKYLEHAATH